MENKEQTTKNSCSISHFLVKSFKQCYLPKSANKTNKPKTSATEGILWLSLSNSVIYQK